MARNMWFSGRELLILSLFDIPYHTATLLSKVLQIPLAPILLPQCVALTGRNITVVEPREKLPAFGARNKIETSPSMNTIISVKSKLDARTAIVAGRNGL